MEGTPSYWQKPLVSNHWTQNKFCWASAVTIAGSQTRFQSILWNQVIFKNNYSTNWHAKINILYLTAFIFIRVYEQGIYMGVENSLLYSLPSCTRVLIRISWFDSNSILTGRTEVEGGGGGWWTHPRVSDMLHYFETNLPLEVHFIGGGTAGALWRHQHNNGFIHYSTGRPWQQSFYMYLNQLIIDLYSFMTNSCLNTWFID